MAGFEEHGQHLAPERDGLDASPEFDSPLIRHPLVFLITLLESNAEKVVEIGNVARAEQSPMRIHLYALHEQVWNPICRVHVMRAAAFIAGVLPEFQKVFDIQVPGLQ